MTQQYKDTLVFYGTMIKGTKTTKFKFSPNTFILLNIYN